MDCLPEEILFHILCCLETKELFNAGRVCSTFYRMSVAKKFQRTTKYLGNPFDQTKVRRHLFTVANKKEFVLRIRRSTVLWLECKISFFPGTVKDLRHAVASCGMMAPYKLIIVDKQNPTVGLDDSIGFDKNKAYFITTKDYAPHCPFLCECSAK
ncbi:hypothetical protein GMAR_ORF41 [Golden Marseillevirus]|uniref:hypothetical protein n=1 Tax=Golden Marseillevirus TaxID=1720526 RepID=UPI000877AB88|nr:hypothetical protein GMAR_ORF41 [Golden Marseillevirus]ALX27416.1 hypothetical protein GMAR_ORF41 [Golden Marseillevirus]